MKRVPSLTFDFKNMMTDQIGPVHGMGEEECARAFPLLDDVYRTFRESRNKGNLAFLDLPYQPTEKIKALAKKVQGRFENFVLLGIGGSALGPIAIQQALHSPYYNLLSKKERGGPRMFFLDNVDPTEVASLLEVLDPSKTAVNVVTKSGGTIETLAQFLIFQKWIYKKVGKEKGAAHFIVTTDPKKGTLREIAQKEGYATLEIPEPVGGRFSVLTPVGLFPAAVSGIDIDLMLQGAADLDQEFQKVPPHENAAVWGAFVHHWAYLIKRRNILVLMPYSEGLVGVAQWFVQLWAESLGKEKDISGKRISVGQTPVVAVGATDQHSQLQLYMEGPVDKTIQFLVVGSFGKDLPFPTVRSDTPIGLLAGHTLGSLLKIEQRAIEASLVESGRPNCKLIVPEINPYYLGALFYFFEFQTAFAGKLYGINPFDQPGVEAGKRIIHKLLKEEGQNRTKETSKRR
ncbi:glucose-6-phosphate isomerase [Candidatus Manganitrophus noduliformans]|uniref:Glucose-6-phosphate isomerase n=1 Tax=Candidatus Manganitrophus noduliformans TaxID=2606439 RepID=A0A7X6IAM5_9BACT|nr:glucose-6-phosphate isomerase [Candidatus Manganitrophus noduliformans]NKE70540.1 glucose-6-phosphate isomerase [Candidatus Manganitrophus noduliformans]